MEIGHKITATYNDGRIFSGTIVQIEIGSSEGVLYGDGHAAPNRTMIRLRKENGNHVSLYLDKCISVEKEEA
jgi:hypothetical protein